MKQASVAKEQVGLEVREANCLREVGVWRVCRAIVKGVAGGFAISPQRRLYTNSREAYSLEESTWDFCQNDW